ncbi:MAG TPA: MnmC family methyltransferase [Polyangiaceae bacterium]|nr:MnmC family methyltransferase [Polyangiaceae bacterium]
MTLDCEVVLTRSGEPAMRDRISGEVMHPVVGPRVESRLLYAEGSKLRERLLGSGPGALLLLDVGLGAGSNAVAALEVALALQGKGRPLRVVSFDQSLSALEQALRPEHREAFGYSGALLEAGLAVLRDRKYCSESVTWELELGTLPDTLARIDAGSADVVYWDPFSPAKNPTLWTVATFSELWTRCRDGATFFTYSAATATRSALLLAGFAVGEGESTGVGKRTTQAAANVRDLARPLQRRWLETLSRSSAPLPSDAPIDALDRIRAAAQFCIG